MFHNIKKTTIALVAVATMGFPLHSASAQSSHSLTIVRNDYSSEATMMPITLPRNFKPAVGMCYLWFPKNSANAMPAPASCEAVIPFGAIMIRS